MQAVGNRQHKHPHTSSKRRALLALDVSVGSLTRFRVVRRDTPVGRLGLILLSFHFLT